MNESCSVPVFIAYRPDTGFRVSALFLSEFHGTAKRFETALQRLRQSIHNHFKNTSIDRETMDERLWLSFAPPMQFVHRSLGFSTGHHWVEGLFAVALFVVAGRQYACLPMLEGLMGDIGAVSDGSDQHQERLLALIMAFFRTQRQEQGPAFDHHRYLSHPSDELGEVDVTIPVTQGRYPFESDDLRLSMDDDELGTGAQEIERVATDWTTLFLDDALPTVVGRDPELDAMGADIHGPDRTPIVLVGPSGCGKTALIQGALKKTLHAKRHHDLHRQAKVWHFDPLRLISGMSVIGQWQRRLELVLSHVRHRLKEQYQLDQPDHLYCDNLMALTTVGRSSQNRLTVGDMLRPYLEKRHFKFIAEATPQAWQKFQQRNRRLADLFRVIRVEPPTREHALRMIMWRRAELEAKHACTFDTPAMIELLKLQGRFAGQQVLPGSVVRMMERLAARHPEQPISTPQVMAAYSQSHHFKEALFSRHVGLDLDAVEQRLHDALIGQPQARRSLLEVVALVKTGLSAPGKPLASLLFIGPTGVGKSEAAKLLADELFERDPHGSEHGTHPGLLRFDMNEYVDHSAVERLIGSPGQPEGQLTSAVRQRQACVLLLDEFEKAHPAVHDLFLQVLGEGRLTDALGRTTDFSSCVIILTSNLGAAEATKTTGFAPNPGDTVHSYREAVERFFRPELVNRIDQVVSFESLSRQDMTTIAQLQLRRVLSRDGFVRRMTFIRVSATALHHLADLGYDPQMGARALKRGMERILTQPLALRLAASPPGNPMLIDIDHTQGQFSTTAMIWRQVDPQPIEPPSSVATQATYTALAEQAQALKSRVLAALDQTPPNTPSAHALQQLRVRLDPLVEALDGAVWDLAQPRGGRGLPAHYTGRSGVRVASSSMWGIARQSLMQKLTVQHDMQDFLNQIHASTVPFVQEESPLIQWQLQLALLRHRVDAMERSGLQTVCISITALQPHQQDIVQAAWDDIEWLMSITDAVEQPRSAPSASSGQRSYEGFGLSQCLADQHGIHYWVIGGQTQVIPVAVSVSEVQSAPPAQPNEIVRLRKIATNAREVNSWTDLRSGLSKSWKFQKTLPSDHAYWLMWKGH